MAACSPTKPSASAAAAAAAARERAERFAEAWAVPGVLDWSLSYFFIKTVTYTILFWCRYYLTLTLDSQATADNLAGTL